MLMIGVDEAGRGPLVGNVVAAAVHLGDFPLEHLPALVDSKKLTESKREALFKLISEFSEFAIGEASVQEIERLNIHFATLLAMKRAINGLLESMSDTQTQQAINIIIDGKYTPNKEDILAYFHNINMRAVIKADGSFSCVSAASIVAKVSRDRQMQALHKQYPQYGFLKHKGYPTKQHKAAIKRHGILKQHRKTYHGIKEFIHIANK